MTPIGGAPCAPRLTGGLPIASTDCRPIVPRAVVLSDAILKPRIIRVDGFGAGEIQTIGISAPFDSIVQPVTTDATFTDPLSGEHGSGITSVEAYGRYLWQGGGGHTLVTAAPIAPSITGVEVESFYERWEYVATGGRGGGGYLKSRAGNTSTPGGHWNGIQFRTDSPANAGGLFLGLNLFGITPPADDLNVISFVGLFVGRPDNVFVNPNPIRGTVPHLVVGITRDRFVVLKRLDVTATAGNPPTYYGTGTWVELARSLTPVPADEWFGLEVGMFLSSRHRLTGQERVPNGFAFARLYDGRTLGTTAAVALNVATRGFADAIVGLAYGSDVRDQFGDGAGNVTQGIAGIGFDTVVAYDNGGAIKRYLYDVRVGTALVNGLHSNQSTQVGGTDRWTNVGRQLTSLDTLQARYNQYTGTEKDLFTLPPVRGVARQMVAVLPFQYSDGIPATFSGQGKILVVSDGVEVSAHQSVPCATLETDEQLSLEVDPATGAPWTLAGRNAALVGWQNDKLNVGSGDSVLEQLGVEDVYREEVITDVEHAPYAPVAAFGFFVEDDEGTVLEFEDTSVDWDGTIVSNHWDFGDGATADNAGRLYALESTVRHTYTSPGTYVVSLTVTDSDGLSTTITKPVVIPNQAPVANFSSSATDLAVDFTDASSDADGSIAARDWDFGDGSGHSSATNPSHTYAAAGTFTVTLVVTDDLGATSTRSHDVTVPPAPTSLGARRAMPLLFADSCDAGVHQSTDRWDFSPNAPTYDATGGRDGGGCVKETSDGGWIDEYWQYTPQASPIPHKNERVIQFVLNLDSKSAAYEVPVVNCYPTLLALSLRPDRRLSLYVDDGAGNAVLLGTSTDPILGTGVVVGHLRVLYDAAAGFIWVRIAGNQVLRFTGIAVWNASHSTQLVSIAYSTGSGFDFPWPPSGPVFDAYEAAQGGILDVRWMDFAVFDPTGFDPDDWPGDVHLGATLATTAALQSDDGDTSQVAMAAVNDTITENVAAIAAVAHVLAVLPFLYQRISGSSSPFPLSRFTLRSGAVDTSIHLDNLSTSYSAFLTAYATFVDPTLGSALHLDRWVFATDPATGVAWLPAAVSALVLELVCEQLAVAAQIRTSQLGSEFAYWID